MDKTEKFWDKQAGGFVADDDDLSIERNQDFITTLRYLRPDAVVLDYGCGGGVVAINIADKVKHIDAIDVSPKIIEVARANAARRGVANIDFAPATIFDSRFRPDQFDVVLSFRVLHVLADVPAVLRRIFELLKPGGVFISVTTCLGEHKLIFGIPVFLARITRIVPIPINKFSLKELCALMAAAGFDVTQVEKMNDRIPTYCVVARKV